MVVSQAAIPVLEIPEERPRKPSAKISRLWKCGHEVNIAWVLEGYRYCPYCGGKYPKNRINLLARWVSSLRNNYRRYDEVGVRL